MQLIVFVSENSKIYASLPDELAGSNPSLVKTLDSSRLISDRADYISCQQASDELLLVRLHYEASEGTCLPVLSGWFEASRELCWTQEEIGYNYSLVRYVRRKPELKLSVVLSTCNQPEWLEKVLWGYESQDVSGFELIIADDGSRKETFDRLQQLVSQLTYPVKHVWHEDKGFRKCDILNKGILAAQTDYLLFSDGDCIPRPDFVSTHLKCRRKGHFLSGGYHKLGMELSQSITKEEIRSHRCFDVKWLKERGMPSSFKNNKLTATGLKRRILNTFTPTNASWNGHNASGWLTDILAVNGFDERMQYGGQDREFGERMENRGISGIQIRYSTVCLHLDHARGYKTKESIQKNVDLRKQTRTQKVQWSPCGIVKEALAARSVKVNDWYDRYARSEEQLCAFRRRGGLYRHLFSLPCRWRKSYYQQQVILATQALSDFPALSDSSGIVLSLTTFPPRIAQLHLVLRSILWQSCRPERIVVWLSEEEFPQKLDDLPEALKELIPYGVDLRFVSGNLRSHKKYYYAFQAFPDKRIVTIDDDLLYPRDTIERLLCLSFAHPRTVCGNVLRQIQMEGNQFALYKKWKKPVDTSVSSSFANVAIGCGGVLYPPGWYDDLLFDQEVFRQYSPSADDLWLKANELKRQVKVTGGGAFFPHPVILPHTQQYSLQKKNNGKKNMNNDQWKALTHFLKLDKLYQELSDKA